MKLNIGHIFLLIFIMGKCTATAQTIYGVSGQIKTPDANIVENGKCAMAILYYSDYHDVHDELVRQWTVNFNVGFMSRVELGVRLAIFPDRPGDSEFYNVGFDRIVSAKMLILDESEYVPRFAIGMQDMVGTRYHNSTYFVAGKEFRLNHFLSLNMNLGYGTELNELLLDDAKDHHFIGVFGRGGVLLFKKLSFSAEYDARDINMGLIYSVGKWLNFKCLLLKMEHLSGGLSLTFTI